MGFFVPFLGLTLALTRNVTPEQEFSGSLHRYQDGRVRIQAQPLIVAERSRFGDWESDTVEGCKGGSGVATH